MKPFSSFILESKSHDILQREFSTIADAAKADYADHLRKVYTSAVEKARVHEGKSYRQLFNVSSYQPLGALANHPLMFFMRGIFHETKKGVMDPSDYRIVDNWQKVMEKEIDQSVALFYTNFITKNTAKLGSIVGDKVIKQINHKLHHDLTGFVRVIFMDGSEFTATFSVTTSMSKNGKWFNQFPTRFTDVINSDGTKMKAASEAKMKKEFH